MALAKMNALDDPWSTPDAPERPSASAFNQPATAPGISTSSLESPWSTPTGPETQAPARSVSGPSAQPPAAQAPMPSALNVMNTLGVAPPQQAPAPPSYTPPYAATLQALQQARDPQSYLATQDQLARQVFTTLSGAGHDVSWADDGQIVVDGRPYELGDGTAAPSLRGPTVPDFGETPLPDEPPEPTAPPPPVVNYNPGPNYDWSGGVTGRGVDPRTQQGGMNQSWQQTPVPAGFDAGKWNDPNKHDPKYDVGHLVAQGASEQDVVAYMAQHYPEFQYLGTDKFRGPDGFIYDFERDREGARAPQWEQVGGGGGGAGRRQLGGGGGGEGWEEGPLLDDPSGGRGMGPYTPGQAPGIDPRLEALIGRLAAHPTSMDPQTVQMMEAADAEQQIEAAHSQDEASKRFGYQTGYIDSPWLASERASTARSADQGILQNRRNIEIEAARTNTNDLRQSIATMANIWTQTQDSYRLSEQLKLEAAKLGLSREQFMYQLQLRLRELEQNDRQFGARLGYDYDELNESASRAYNSGG